MAVDGASFAGGEAAPPAAHTHRGLWARIRAIPGHQKVLIVIGAAGLVLMLMALRNRGNSSGSAVPGGGMGWPDWSSAGVNAGWPVPSSGPQSGNGNGDGNVAIPLPDPKGTGGESDNFWVAGNDAGHTGSFTPNNGETFRQWIGRLWSAGWIKPGGSVQTPDQAAAFFASYRNNGAILSATGQKAGYTGNNLDTPLYAGEQFSL